MRQEERLTSFCFLQFLQCKTERCIDRKVAVFLCADRCSKLEGGVGEFFWQSQNKKWGNIDQNYRRGVLFFFFFFFFFGESWSFGSKEKTYNKTK
jgi:hypothetical protein